MNRRSTSYIFRCLAGIYLIYLAVSIFRDGILSGEMTGAGRIGGIAACVLFIAIGVGVNILSIRNIIRDQKQKLEEQKEADRFLNQAPEKKERSLAERASGDIGGFQEAESEEDPAVQASEDGAAGEDTPNIV